MSTLNTEQLRAATELNGLRIERAGLVRELARVECAIEDAQRRVTASWADMSSDSDSDSDSETEEVEDDSGWTTVTAKAPTYK